MAILALALAVRLSWSLSRPTDEASLSSLPDQREYLELGRNLLHAHSLSFVDLRFNDTVYAFRTPGYPVFLAICGGNIRIARSAQAIVDTLTVLAAYLLARRWLPPPACAFAAILVALNPFLIYFTGLILSETLFTALLAWGMVLLICRQGRFWILGGFLLAVAILVRPGAIGFPVVLGVLAALANRDLPRPYHWPLPVATTMLLLTLLVLGPWAFRNYRLLGKWVWTSTNSGFTTDERGCAR